MVWYADYCSSRIGGTEEPKPTEVSLDPNIPLKNRSKMVVESHHSLLALNQPPPPRRTNEPPDHSLDGGTSMSQLLTLVLVLVLGPYR